MAQARELMHQGAECVTEQEPLLGVARRMADQDIGSVLVCDKNQRVCGIITDRDIVVKCLSAGHDPAGMTAADLAQGHAVTIDAAADAAEVLQAMENHLVRRLPVIEGGRPVGIISEADLARHLSEEQVGHFVEVISAST